MNQKSVTVHVGSELMMKIFTLSGAALILMLALLYYSSVVNFQATLLIFICSCLLSSLCFIYIFYKNRICVLSVTEDNLKFPLSEDGKPVEELNLPISQIAFFETRFNKIIVHDIHNNSFSIPLDRVKSDRKRWEIKELLRQHIQQQRFEKAV